MYEGMIAESVAIAGHNGDDVEAYYARPLGAGPFPGVVVIHHMPGWDEWTREVVRKFAQHGYAAISPHLYARLGPGSPDDLVPKNKNVYRVTISEKHGSKGVRVADVPGGTRAKPFSFTADHDIQEVFLNMEDNKPGNNVGEVVYRVWFK